MLSDKEKKAIELLEDYLICGNKEGVLYRNLRIILRIIEKQSKEIEELKEKNRQSKMRIVQLENEITARIEDVNQYYTPNDKIKAKIEPRLKELDENMKKEWKEYGNSREYQDMEDDWNFLQSLLEKELEKE